MDDLDDLLGRVQRTREFLAHRALTHPGNESLDHGQVDVGLEQSDPYLTQDLVDVGVAQLPLAAQSRKDPIEAV